MKTWASRKQDIAIMKKSDGIAANRRTQKSSDVDDKGMAANVFAAAMRPDVVAKYRRLSYRRRKPGWPCINHQP